MTFRKTLLVLAAVCLADAAVLKSSRIHSGIRKVIGIVATAAITFTGPVIDNAYGIPALEAATRAMTEKKVKTVVERDFDSLPEGAKKRKALSYCKDNTPRKAAGYSSASECTEAVLSGNFDAIVKGAAAMPGIQIVLYEIFKLK